jgi:curved DNA-binding protein CbpA
LFFLQNDLYGALEVKSSIPQGEIKKAYQRLSVANHPDRNPNNKVAAQRMVDINKAYSVLKDASKREQYDAFISTLPLVLRPVYGQESSKGAGGWTIGLLVVGVAMLGQWMIMWGNWYEKAKEIKAAKEFAPKTAEGAAGKKALDAMLLKARPSISDLFLFQLLLVPVRLIKGESPEARAEREERERLKREEAERLEREGREEREEEEKRAKKEEEQAAKEEQMMEKNKEKLRSAKAQAEALALAEEKAFQETCAKLKAKVLSGWEAAGGPAKPYEALLVEVGVRLFPLLEGEDFESIEETMADSLMGSSMILGRIESAVAQMAKDAIHAATTN